MRLALLLILFLILTKTLNGQEFIVQNYTDENGLPQNSVKSIATDNAGFIWLATENGLVRYDGQEFKLYDKNKTNTSSNRMISFKKAVDDKLFGITENWQLIEIKDGRVSTIPINYQNVFSFEKSSYSTYYFALGFPNGLESYVKEMPYIINKKGGYTYKIFKGTILLYKQNKLINSTKFNYKSLWHFFLLNNELYHIDEKLNVTKFGNNNPIRINILGDLITKKDTNTGILFWNINANEAFIYSQNTLYSLELNKGNNQIDSKIILPYIKLDSIGLKSVYHDKITGDVYIGTGSKGLYIYKKKQLKTLINTLNLGNNVFYAYIPLVNNNILSANGDIIKKDNTVSSSDFLKKLSSKYTLALDSKHNLWTAIDNNLYTISADLKKTTSNYQFSSIVNTVMIDDEQVVWAGDNKGVYRLQKNAKSFTKIDALNKIDSVSFLKKSKNILWIGTTKGLLYHDLVKKKTYQINALTKKNIRSLYLRADEVWITTYGDGYYVIKDKKLIKLPNDQNNYLNTAHCILEDKNGFFWISTNKGLFKTAISDLLAYINKQTKTIYYTYYDRTAGLNTNEFNGGCQPCGSILNDGDFSFPTMNGIVMFNPLNLVRNEPNKPIYIDQITLDNIDLKTTSQSLAIPLNFSRLNIHLSTPYYGNKENLIFEYKLANQSIWSKSTDQIISLTYLPSGKNTLNIRKINGFGINNYTYKNIVLIVPLHYYETWWFILSCTIFFILIVYAIIKLRTKIIKDRNTNLEKRINESTIALQQTLKAYEFSKNRLDHQNYFQNKLIAAITHDIKTPLKYLMMTGEALFKAENKAINKEGLKAIYTSSSQIYHFTDNLVQYAKSFTTKDLDYKHTFNLHDLIEEKIAIFSQVANIQHTTIINTIDKNVSIKTNGQLLAVILHNLLDNAVKFTVNGSVEFSYFKHVKSYTITIKDTGVGLQPYQVEWCNDITDNLEQTKSIEDTSSPAGLGLIMVKELNKIINGNLKVQSVLEEGTTFEITLMD